MTTCEGGRAYYNVVRKKIHKLYISILKKKGGPYSIYGRAYYNVVRKKIYKLYISILKKKGCPYSINQVILIKLIFEFIRWSVSLRWLRNHIYVYIYICSYPTSEQKHVKNLMII